MSKKVNIAVTVSYRRPEIVQIRVYYTQAEVLNILHSIRISKLLGERKRTEMSDARRWE